MLFLRTFFDRFTISFFIVQLALNPFNTKGYSATFSSTSLV